MGYDYFLSNHETTWSTAELACRVVGMRLARIDSVEEFNWVQQTFRKSGAWIGLNDRQQEGQFVNSDGCPRPFISETNNQPGNSDDNDCIQLSTTHGLYVNQCTQSFPFLCKKNDVRVRSQCGAFIFSK